MEKKSGKPKGKIMFDLLEKLFEGRVDPEKRMRDYHKKVLNTKLLSSIHTGKRIWLEFWLLTNGDIIPSPRGHLLAVEAAGADQFALREAGAFLGQIMKNELSLIGEKKFTTKQISKLKNLQIEHRITRLVVEALYLHGHGFSVDIKSAKELAYYLEYGKEQREAINKGKLLDQIIEATAADIRRKHRSIKRLFPDFDVKTKGVEDKGGLRLVDQDVATWKFQVHSGTQNDVWYDNYLHFKNIKPTLERLVKDRRLWVSDKTKVDLRKLATAFMKVVDIQMFCSCFTGDTKIPLLDGRILTIEEILKEYNTKETFWIYASDEKGDFVPAKAKCLGVTKKVKQLIKVTLDNEKEIKCTPEHPFRMRDGSYKSAVDLAAGDSLMPLYLKEQKPNSRFSQSYLKVKLNSKNDLMGRPIWKMVHSIVAEIILKKELEDKKKKLIETGIEKYLVVHHRNAINTFDNTPENLQWKGKKEHWFYHANHDHTNSIRGTKLAWEDPEYRKKQVKNRKRAGKISQEMYPENAVNFNQKGIEFMQSDEGREFARDRMRDTWANNREAMLKVDRSNSNKASSKAMKKYWTLERKKVQSQRMRELNNAHSRDDKGHWVVPQNNHKVKSVEIINFQEEIPVYDLSVEDYGNFALEAGVFVHNCPAFRYWGPAYILNLQKYDASYNDDELRPATKRNPKGYGALCKHLDRVMKVLPFYGSTLSKWIKDFYAGDIERWEAEAMEQFGWAKQAAAALGAKKRVEVPPPEEKPEVEPDKPVTKAMDKAIEKPKEEPESVEPEEPIAEPDAEPIAVKLKGEPEKEPEEVPKEEPKEVEPEEEPEEKPKKRSKKVPSREKPKWSADTGEAPEEEYF